MDDADEEGQAGEEIEVGDGNHAHSKLVVGWCIFQATC